VDNAKALGIAAVFYGHVVESLYTAYEIPAADFQYKLIYSFHIPLFFILSGYVLKGTPGRTLSAFIKNKLTNRIVPFVFFNLLILPLYFVAGVMSNQHLDLVGYLQKAFYLLWGRAPFNPVTWFLSCLLTLEVLNFFLYPLLRRSRLALCAAMVSFYAAGWLFSFKAGAIGRYIPLVVEYDCFYFREALVAYSFYLSGHLMASLPALDGKMGRYADVLLLLATGACALFTFNLNTGPFVGPPVVLFSNGTYGSFLLFPLTALAGSICIISISRLMPPVGFLRFLGTNTLILMGLNWVFVRFANLKMINYGIYALGSVWPSAFQQHINLTSTALCMVLACVTLLLCAPVVVLLKRYVPSAVGHRKGMGVVSRP
jgi:acyltransferase